MTVSITRIPEISTIHYELHPPLNAEADVKTNMVETVKLKEEVGAPVYRIIDVTNLKMSFGEMTESMALERNREGGSADPDVITCFVGSGQLVEFGTKALAEQDQYGKGKVYLFTSVDEAKEFIQKDREDNS